MQEQNKHKKESPVLLIKIIKIKTNNKNKINNKVAANQKSVKKTKNK